SGDGDGASLGATDATLGAAVGAAVGAGDGEAPVAEQPAAMTATKARALTPLTVRMSGVLSSRNGTGGSVAVARQPFSGGEAAAGSPPRVRAPRRPIPSSPRCMRDRTS